MKWLRAYTINKDAFSSDNYISKVVSYISFPSIKDSLNDTYVQLGEFKNESDKLDYIYVVNRRTLPEEKRNIVVNLNKSITGSHKWEIQEVGTNIKWIIPGNGNFQSVFEPAEGKLFRLIPLSQ